MPLPPGVTQVAPAGPDANRPAFLVRFPEDVWARLEKTAASGEAVTISLDDGMHLNLPGSSSIPLTAQPNGAASEIHTLSSSADSLTPHAVATSRLALPLTSASSSKAADRLKAQNDAHEQERKDRTDRIHGLKKGKPIGSAASTPALASRMVGSPAVPPPVSASGSGSGQPVVPLKTRVVQLLALGAQTIDQIVARVGMSENEVMRVVNVVGKETVNGYVLQPTKYTQVKIGPWKYTYAEKIRVIQLAKEAFDALGLPEDADERADLDRKESEVMSGGAGSGSSEQVETPPPVSAPLPPATVAPSSPALPPAASTPPKKDKPKKKEALGLIGKQKAKFAAEKRASSLPNVKKVDGTASPRLDRVPADTGSTSSKSSKSDTKADAKPAAAEPRVVKRKREEAIARTTKAASPASTNSSEESRGRSTVPKPVKVNGDDRTKKKSRTSPDYSSSDENAPRKKPTTKDIPRKAASASTFHRKPAPPELKLNGHRDEPPDPEALRERYEELFPAYEQLSKKLAKLHRDAEAEEEGEVVEVDGKELAKLVARWEKWHGELEGIRRWFS